MSDAYDLSPHQTETWVDRMRVRMTDDNDMDLARRMGLHPSSRRGGSTSYAKTVAGYLGQFRRGEQRGLRWVFGDEARLEALTGALGCSPDDLRADLRLARGDHGLSAGALLIPGFEDLGAFSYAEGFVLPPCFASGGDGVREDAAALTQRLEPGQHVRVSGPGARTTLRWLADAARARGWRVQRWTGSVPSGRARVLVDLDGSSVVSPGQLQAPPPRLAQDLKEGGHLLLAQGAGDLRHAPVDRAWLDAVFAVVRGRLPRALHRMRPDLDALAAAGLAPWEAGVLLRDALEGGEGTPRDAAAARVLFLQAARRRLAAEGAPSHRLSLVSHELLDLGLATLADPGLDLAEWAGGTAGATASAVVDELPLTAKQRAVLRAAIPEGAADDVADTLLASGLVGGREGDLRLRGDGLLASAIAPRLHRAPRLLRRALLQGRHGLLNAVAALEDGPKALVAALHDLPASLLLRAVRGLGPASQPGRFGAHWLLELPLTPMLAARLLALVEAAGQGALPRRKIEQWWGARTFKHPLKNLSLHQKVEQTTPGRMFNDALPALVALVAAAERVAESDVDAALDAVCGELGVPREGPWMAFQEWKLTGGVKAPVSRDELPGFLVTWAWGPPTAEEEGGCSMASWRVHLKPAPHWLERARADAALAVKLVRDLTARQGDRPEAASVLPELAKLHPDEVAACLVELADEALTVVVDGAGSGDAWHAAEALLAPLAAHEALVARRQRAALKQVGARWVAAVESTRLKDDLQKSTPMVEGLPEVLATLPLAQRTALLRGTDGGVGTLAIEAVRAGVDPAELEALLADVLEGRAGWPGGDEDPNHGYATTRRWTALVQEALCALSPDRVTGSSSERALLTVLSDQRALDDVASNRNGRRVVWALADALDEPELALEVLARPPYNGVLHGLLEGDDQVSLDRFAGQIWHQDRDAVLRLVSTYSPTSPTEWWHLSVAVVVHGLPAASLWTLLRTPSLTTWDLWADESFLAPGRKARAGVLSALFQQLLQADPAGFSQWLLDHADFAATTLAASHIRGWWRSSGLRRDMLEALLGTSTCEEVGPGPIAALLSAAPDTLDRLLTAPRTRTSTLAEMFATSEGTETALGVLAAAGRPPEDDVVAALFQAHQDTGISLLHQVCAHWPADQQAQLWRSVARRHRRLRESAWVRLAGVEAAPVAPSSASLVADQRSP